MDPKKKIILQTTIQRLSVELPLVVVLLLQRQLVCLNPPLNRQIIQVISLLLPQGDPFAASSNSPFGENGF